MYHRVAELDGNGNRRVLVHGAGGGVGTALLELGRLAGFELYGTASAAKQEVVSRYGAHFINYKSEDFEDVIRERTGDGVDLVIDPIGGSHFARSFRTLRPGGHLVATASMASVRGLSMLRTIFHYLQVALWETLPNGRSATFLDLEDLNKDHPDWYQQDMNQLLHDLAEGSIDPLIAEVMPLAEAASAHRLLLEEKVAGKIVLVPERATAGWASTAPAAPTM